MMNKCGQDFLETLPELSEKEVTALFEKLGIGAFTPCELQTALGCVEPQASEPYTAIENGIIKFPSGFLKLTRGMNAESRHFVAIDFHDYREAIFDYELVRDAYLRFAGTVRAWLYASGVRPDVVECACCPEQGSVFVSIESERWPPRTDVLIQFLVSYFRSGEVVSGLHRSFGEAAIARAKETVPSLVAVLAM